MQLRGPTLLRQKSPKDSAFTAYPPFQVDQARTSNHRNDDFQDGLMGLQEDDWNDKKSQCAKRQEILGCIEVIVYKTDKHGFRQKV